MKGTTSIGIHRYLSILDIDFFENFFKEFLILSLSEKSWRQREFLGLPDRVLPIWESQIDILLANAIAIEKLTALTQELN